VDIETAAFSGAISNTTLTGFTYTSQFQRRADNYTLAFDYIAPSTLNGNSASGSGIYGYDYWNFAFPTEIAYGSTAEADFELATTLSIPAYGVSFATWNDPAAPGTWALRSTMLVPVPLGLATVAAGLGTSGVSSTFQLTPVGASSPITVELINASGSVPLVYDAYRDHVKLTMTPLDIGTTSGLAQLSAALTPGAYVNVYGLPKSDGAVQGYTLLYYTGIHPKQANHGNGNGGGNGG
jgi:hypothetical protein